MKCFGRWNVLKRLHRDDSQIYLISMDKEDSVVKFTQRYGWETHDALSSAGVAPLLRLEQCR